MLNIAGFSHASESYSNNLTKERIVVNDCRISESKCRVEISMDKIVTISINPKGIPHTKPLRMDVYMQGIDAEQVSIGFEGIDVDYNTIDYLLTKNNLNNFTGEGYLSICLLRKMHWMANVSIVVDGVSQKISLPFSTH